MPRELVLAGNYNEYRAYLHESGLLESDTVYYSGYRSILGRHFKKVTVVGSFHESLEDSHERLREARNLQDPS